MLRAPARRVSRAPCLNDPRARYDAGHTTNRLTPTRSH